MKGVFIIVSILALATAGAKAGTLYELKCVQPDCDFLSVISLGGGRKFDQASGYCQQCRSIVSVEWNRDSGERPLSAVWDAISGRLREVFSCPDCKKGVLAVEEIEDFRHCPKCRKAGIKTTLKLMFD